MSWNHNIPVLDEWWTYHGNVSGHTYKVSFRIRDIVARDPYENSWVIYSNDDDFDFFVVRLGEFLEENSSWSFSHIHKEENNG